MYPHPELFARRAEALRAEAQREREARAARGQAIPSRLTALLRALHLRPRLRPA